MGPSKRYACTQCGRGVTVSPTSNRILIYGGLLFFVPAGLFYKLEPSVLSASIMATVFFALLGTVILTQRIIRTDK